MPDGLDGLSVDELMSLKGIGGSQAAPAQASGLDALSAEELLRLKGSTVNKDWNILDSVRNLGSGVVEGTTGLVGLASDLNPLQAGGPQLDFPTSKIISGGIEPYLSERDPQYRYARTAGNFLAPVPVKGANTIKTLLTSVLAGVGAQGAEDFTGDKKIAPLVGAVATGSLASGGSDILSFLKRTFIGASGDEIAGSAARAMAEQTGLTTEQLARVNAAPVSGLEALQTTAERTGNPGMAQIERTLASTGERANTYSTLNQSRIAEREGLLSSIAPGASVNKESLGAALIDTAENVQGKMRSNSKAFWSGIPRDETIPVTKARQALGEIYFSKEAGLPINAKVKSLVEQVLDNEKKNLTSGALQDIRSDALSLMRDRELTGFEKSLLTNLEDNIDTAMAEGLSDKSYQTWKGARQATAAEKGTYARGTAGGYLVGDTARTSNVLEKVFKGDTQSVDELKAAIGESPEVLSQVQRGIMDMVPRNAEGNLTPASMKKFLGANESGLKALYGEKHFSSMERILGDMRSQESVRGLADLASRGGSPTAQRTTVAGAVQSLTTDSLVPGAGGYFSKVINAVKQGAGIEDAKAVEDLLFKAALDPKYAELLSMAPTNTRIFNALESLSQAGRNILGTGGLMGAKELSRTEDNRPPIAKLLEKTVVKKPSSLKSAIDKVIPQKETTMGAEKVPTALMDEIKKDPVDHAIMLMESGGDPLAKNKDQPGNTASGLFQLVSKTAKNLGVKDVFDPQQNYEGYKKLKEDTIRKFGADDVYTIYASHYLGEGVFRKFLNKEELSTDEQAQVDYLKTKLLPKLRDIYMGVLKA